MRRILASTLFAALFALVTLASVDACDKPHEGGCPMTNSDVTVTVTVVDGHGAKAVLAVGGCPKKAPDVIAALKAMIEHCATKECDCPGAAGCAFAVEGLTYAVTEVEGGLKVDVTPFDQARIDEFKTRLDKHFQGEGSCGCGKKEADAGEEGCDGCKKGCDGCKKGCDGCKKEKKDCGCGK